MKNEQIMREIKFRCWRDGYMCSYYPKWRFVENGLYWEEKDADPDKIGAGVPVLMQFTGLLDKNGKEIYEGDIVAGVVDVIGLTVDGCIIFEQGYFGIQTTINDNETLPLYGLRYIYVLGNIYENPELLK